jgi:hypothetical protein
LRGILNCPRNRLWSVIGLIGLVVCGGKPAAGISFSGPGRAAWGISCDDVGIVSGSALADAVLVLEGIRRSSPSAGLQITLLRNPVLGFQNSIFPQTDEIDLATVSGPDASDRVVLFFSGINDPKSPVWKVFRRPFVMPQADGSKMEYSSAVLEMMDILGTEKTFGLGFRMEGEGTVQVDRIWLHLSVLPYRGTGQPLARTYSLIEEDFDSGGLAGWSIVDQGVLYAPSAWSITDGRLRQDNNTCQQNLRPSMVDMLGTFAVCRASRKLADFQMAADIRSEDDDAIGIMFRYRDPANYYRFSWDQQRRTRRLVKCHNGQFTILAHDAVGYEIGNTYRVAIVARGPQFAVAIDGTPIFQAWDSEIPDGSIALYCCAQQGAIFDNLRIEAAANRTDRLMAPIGSVAGNTAETMQIPIASAIPIPSARYWAEPAVDGAEFADGQWIWSPTPAQAGLHLIRVLAEADDAFDSQTAQVQVRAVNHPPQLEPIATQTVAEADMLVVIPKVTDPDGDPVELLLENPPAGVRLENGRLSWKPDYSQAGQYSITIVAFDGQLESRATVPITVLHTNRPPVILQFPATKSLMAGRYLNIPIQAVDPDGDTVEISSPNLPAGAILSENTLTWMPGTIQSGIYDIEIVASDGIGNQSYWIEIRVY